jgi:tetratricopeptide (TPR) repeat protein
MASVAITDTGDCLFDLGRLNEAAAAYEEGIKRAAKLTDRRQAAVSKFQLGSVRLLQERYTEALKIYAETRDTFEALGEPRAVATAWHQIGMVHEDAGQAELAEQAYRQSLAIRVRENDLTQQAVSLGQLGNLYHATGRLEDAASLHRQAAEARVRLKDLAGEGKARNNLGSTPIKLKRHDEARQELQRAIECDKPFGHAAQPWKTWSALEALERATGHAQAAQAARHQALKTYLAYRRANGVSQSPPFQAQLFSLVAQAIQQNAPREARDQLAQLASRPGLLPLLRSLVAKLQSLLAGDRSPALAADPELDYGNAAELQLLLEQLRQA